MTAHRDLTGSDLHEPKGIEDAAADQVYVADGSGSGEWTSIALSIPIGAIIDYGGTTAPSGWLLCYGQNISRTTYSDLFSAIGVTYGSGDGSTTFTLPDLRGRVVAGQDDMGGTSANRLTGVTGSVNGDTLGGTGGAETHTLSSDEMPSHTHVASVTDPGHTHGYTDRGSGDTARGTAATDAASDSSTEDTTDSATTGITVSNANTGGGSAHNNVQPTIILNKIIYSGVS